MNGLYFVTYLYGKLRIFNNCCSCSFMKVGLCESNKKERKNNRGLTVNSCFSALSSLNFLNILYEFTTILLATGPCPFCPSDSNRQGTGGLPG